VREQILSAAEGLFSERGYDAVNVSDVVAASGVSVGSIYHHFGGKYDLFFAIWSELQESLIADATRRVADARKQGVTDALQLFDAGARAFFEGVWSRRRIARIFFLGDVPPAFASTRRERGQQWLRKNSILLRLGNSPRDRMLVGVYTAVIAEAAQEIVICATRDSALDITDAALEIVATLDPRRQV
jgi:AcrR family transcriptional regulator